MQEEPRKAGDGPSGVDGQVEARAAAQDRRIATLEQMVGGLMQTVTGLRAVSELDAARNVRADSHIQGVCGESQQQQQAQQRSS